MGRFSQFLAGIMSATLGVLLKEVEPALTIAMFASALSIGRGNWCAAREMLAKTVRDNE